MKVEADRPIVAERSMYFGDDGAGGHTGAHDSVGSPILAKTWFLPDGSTHAAFWENILICSPNDGPANVSLRFMKPDSSVVEKTLVVPPTSRLTVSANALAPDEDVSTEVDSDVPVVAERSLYFADMQGGTNSIGIPVP